MYLRENEVKSQVSVLSEDPQHPLNKLSIIAKTIKANILEDRIEMSARRAAGLMRMTRGCGWRANYI